MVLPDTGGGRGQHIDASLFEPILLAISQAVARWKPDQPSPAPHRQQGAGIGGARSTPPMMATMSWFPPPPSVTRRISLRWPAGAPRPPVTDSDADALVAAWMQKHSLRQVVDMLTEKRIPVATVNDIELGRRRTLMCRRAAA